MLEDQNEDEDDDEIQGPVLREDENYYAECMSLAQSSSCVTLADQDGQEIVYEQGTTTHYETGMGFNLISRMQRFDANR